MHPHPNSGRKSFFLVSILALILAGIAMICFTTANYRRISEENLEYLVDSAERTADSIDSAIADGYDNIKILSELVSRSLTEPAFDITSIQELIQNSVFDFMEFADRDGMDHNITGGVSDARDRQYYLDAKAGNIGMELIYVSRATHETLLMFYAPIYYKDTFVGSLVGVYQAANRITNLLSAEYFGEPATSYLATGEYRIIASNEGFNPETVLDIRDLAGEDEPLRAKLTSILEAGGTGTYSKGSRAAGGCIRKLPRSGFYLLQMFPEAASTRMIREANRIGYLLVGFLLLLGALILFSVVRFYRRQRKDVEQARQMAEEANAAKSGFLFNMSHDIRTPMNAITGFTEKAIRHMDDREILADSLDKVRSSSQYLLQILNDILDMSKIESGKMELNEQIHAFTDYGVDLIRIFESDAARKGITMHSDIRIDAGRYIWLDDSRLRQILANLLSNAIKYTSPGGEIWFRSEELSCEREGYVRFRTEIRDTGRGMSKEFLSKIFDAFEREESATKSGEQGTGLGMAIVKRLVDTMGGTIDIQSEPGIGTDIVLFLDFRLASEAEVLAFHVSAAQELTESHHTMDGKRVLLVEDNELNREIATDLLEEAGLTVECAPDGDIAVEMVRTVFDKQEYDYYAAVLMDIQMPNMDGYEATREIRALPTPEDMHLPIIAMTANAFEEDRKNALAAGMDAHIAKPIDMVVFRKTLEKYL